MITVEKNKYNNTYPYTVIERDEFGNVVRNQAAMDFSSAQETRKEWISRAIEDEENNKAIEKQEIIQNLTIYIEGQLERIDASCYTLPFDELVEKAIESARIHLDSNDSLDNFDVFDSLTDFEK